MNKSSGQRYLDNEDTGLVAVAIDTDKGSQHALRWTADHLASKAQPFILLHVRKKPLTIPTPSGRQVPISEVNEEVAYAFLEQADLQTKEILLPYQCYCNRRGLQYKEVIIDDTDVPRAIVNYVLQENIDKLVLGASSRNAIMRTFKGADVPTSVSKAAPEFCSVYVISKGRISSVRPATNPNRHPGKGQSNNVLESSAKFQSTKSEPSVPPQVDIAPHCLLARSKKLGHGHEGGLSMRGYDCKMAEKINLAIQGGGQLDSPYQNSASCPSSIDQQVNYYQRDNADFGSQRPRLPNLYRDYPDELKKSFESNRSDLTRSFESNRSELTMSCESSRNSFESSRNSTDSNRSGGQMHIIESHRIGGYLRSFESNTSSLPNWSGASSSYEHSPSAFQEDLESLEDGDAELRRLKLELQQTMDVYNKACKDALSAHQMVNDLNSRRAEEAAIQMAENERERYRTYPEASQIAQVAEIETNKRINAENKLLQEMENKKVFDSLSVDVRYRRYTAQEIQKATDCFSEDLKIGEGGYGPVFKGTLDHTLVAIKILQSNASQGMRQFQQEVEVLSCIRHPNMVLLMGACPEYGSLVYEFMANGSLEDRLFCRDNTPPLSWQLRFKIAAEVATGLLFLHQTKPEPLVHRDLKPANILLDSNFTSKIADVGLARLLPPSVAKDVTQYHMTAAAGTFCYIDPEYQKSGMLCIKSDIYALGIIFLQLITARPPMGLAHNMEEAMEVGELEEMLDPKVPDWPMEETIQFAKLALKCCELRRKDRPDLGTVVLPVLNRLRDLAYQSLSNLMVSALQHRGLP
ncbi:PREDICTED: U-box domain-containing protein 35-like [Nelumbo nucifera]|uniref:U-box domain-containing protein 35-like n=1 Tax=Nelumbo nucifera TaxID=4432 RepID=A0A1U8AI31_NELNU|nr:PREDICTED: U-box domain-containing protein 35-like [Nelumbo nucifera]XP_010261771.1 PREDICTED: U-box domain-containing protein 35-like [Nelumbo nucifera]